MKKLIFIFALLLLAGQCWPATQTITGLPYTVTAHSGDTWDTLVIDPDSLVGVQGGLHSDSMGIIFGANNDYWLLDLRGTDGQAGTADDDSIVFGMDSTSYEYGSGCGVAGIYIPAAFFTNPAESIIVKGGYIVHAPANVDENTEYTVAGKTAMNATGIFVYNGAKNFILDSVTIVVKGFGESAYGISSGSHGIYVRGTGILLRNTKIYTKHYGQESRMAFLSNCVNYAGGGKSPSLTGNQTYHIRAESCYFSVIGHMGLNLYGPAGDDKGTDSLFVAQIEGCSLTVDNNNSFTGVGYTNGWAIHYRGAGSEDPYYSYITNNVFLSGTSFGGGRGVELREVNSKLNNLKWPDTVLISGNTFDNHQGTDEEYESVWSSMCMKVRRGNFHTRINNNTFTQTLDTNSAYVAGYKPYHQYGVCVAFQFEMDAVDTWRAPYDIIFENNRCSLLVVRDSTGGNHIWGTVLSLSGMPDGVSEIDTTIRIRENYLYSEGGTCVYAGSQWDASLQYFRFGPNDTMVMNDDSGFSKAVYSLTGHTSYGNNEIFTKDPVYMGDAYDTSVSHWSRAAEIAGNATNGPWELGFQRTCFLYVKGNNGDPVVGATVTATNDYSQQIINGNTNNNGLVQGVVNYYYYNRFEADSAGFNDFIIYGYVGADNDTDTLTVSWTKAGATDTLYLANTAGTGTWLPGEEQPDTTLNIIIDGLKLKGLKISHEEDINIYDGLFAAGR